MDVYCTYDSSYTWYILQRITMGLIDFKLDDIGSVFKDIREAITGKAIIDPDKAMDLELKLRTLEQSLLQGQININIEEAKSANWFVAGWRPYIGWTCGFGLSWTFVLQPMFTWVAILYGSPDIFPTLNTGELMNLVIAMLGLGGLRTYEKSKGVNR